MNIVITLRMIRAGNRGACRTCPIALGFAAAGFPDVMVRPAYVDFYKDNKFFATLPLPSRAQYFRQRFDDFKPVDPFEFDMPGLQPGVIPVTDFKSSVVA